MTLRRALLMIFLLCLGLLSGCNDGDRAEKNDPAGEAEQATARTEIERGPVRIVVEIEPGEARFSDEPTLTLTVDAQEGAEVAMPPFGESLGSFRVRDFRETRSQSEPGRFVTRQIYTLEPMTTGECSIYPITFSFTDNRPEGDGKVHTVETEGLTIQVASVLDTDMPDLAELRPGSGPVALPRSPTAMGWWIAGGALLVLAATCIVVRLRRKNQDVPLEKKLSPRELAYLEFQELLEQNLIEVDIKLFYVALTGIVRRYIERTTGVRAPEQTTEEFLHEIGSKPVFPPAESTRLQRFLEAADLVKFAALQPGRSEIEESFVRAKAFVGIEEEEAAA